MTQVQGQLLTSHCRVNFMMHSLLCKLFLLTRTIALQSAIRIRVNSTRARYYSSPPRSWRNAINVRTWFGRTFAEIFQPNAISVYFVLFLKIFWKALLNRYWCQNGYPKCSMFSRDTMYSLWYTICKLQR